MRTTLFLLMAMDGSSGSGIIDTHTTGQPQKWEGEYNFSEGLWQSPSPTNPAETLGQSTLRVARDLHIEAAQHGVDLPNRYVATEAKDLIAQYPVANEVFTTAAQSGFAEKGEDGAIDDMMATLLGRQTEAETPADVNPAYTTGDRKDEVSDPATILAETDAELDDEDDDVEDDE